MFGWHSRKSDPPPHTVMVSVPHMVVLSECPMCGETHVMPMTPLPFPVAWDGDVAIATGQCPLTGEIVHQTAYVES